MVDYKEYIKDLCNFNGIENENQIEILSVIFVNVILFSGGKFGEPLSEKKMKALLLLFSGFVKELENVNDNTDEYLKKFEVFLQ